MQPRHTLQLQAERLNKTSCTQTPSGIGSSGAYEVALLNANTGASLVAPIDGSRIYVVDSI